MFFTTRSACVRPMDGAMPTVTMMLPSSSVGMNSRPTERSIQTLPASSAGTSTNSTYRSRTALSSSGT